MEIEKDEVLKKEDLIKQLDEVLAMMKDIKTPEDFISLAKNNPKLECEINYSSISIYEGEPMEACRVEYENVMVYFNDKFEPSMDQVSVYDGLSGCEDYCGNLKELPDTFTCYQF